MSNILILYSTTDGHTREICRYLKKVIEQHEHHVVIDSVDSHLNINMLLFDKIILGASIRYGKHKQNIYDFIKINKATLESKQNAFFSVNVVARKPDKNKPDTNPYLIKFLNQISWKPKELAVFAGKIDYQRYRFWDRLMIRMIMWMTKGPTDIHTVIEFTDWKQVETFGHRIAKI